MGNGGIRKYTHSNRKHRFFYILEGSLIERHIDAESHSKAKVLLKLRHGSKANVIFIDNHKQPAHYDKFSSMYMI